MRLHLRRERVAQALALAVCLLLAVRPGAAQFADDPRDQLIVGEAPSNVFFTWEGTLPFAGADIDVPRGWTLQHAQAVSRGVGALPLEIEQIEGDGSRYRLRLDQEALAVTSLVLRVQTGSGEGRAELALTPLVRRSGTSSHLVPQRGLRTTRSFKVEPRRQLSSNRVLSFNGEDAPVRLRASHLGDLSPAEPYTVEYWFKTTDLSRVLLSSWSGRESDPYPLEMVVAPDGRLLSYRGVPGEHLAMATRGEVADGAWHHVAVVHDAEAGWTRLYLDGMAEDSLYTPHQTALSPAPEIAVGGRPTGEHEVESRGFQGQIDELRVWREARTATALRRDMHRPLSSAEKEVFVLSFEEEIPQELLIRPSRARRIRSDLSLADPIQALRARADGELITLTWETRDRETDLFIIERSEDGASFEEVGQVRSGQVSSTSVDGEMSRYAFTDEDPDAQLLYYRIRRRLSDGTERVTASIKIGRGDVERPRKARLLGNYPNPFNASTTITYQLAERMQVRLTAWDLGGQPVAELVNSVQDPGHHEITFEAGELPSGTYLVRLQTPTDVGWWKLTLMK